ncbi:MAG: prepilin-type N-terminal cleavage/methylation domain-containing protein [Lawsonibacter sp.]|nr:prepilin-type N-terminal cleavage/methylation domain-containing protein [Lawsonibacter sp.]
MKQKRKWNENGFTLIELVVSAAILGLVILTAMGLMVASARTYSSVTYTLRLQYESQLAMAQLQEAILDCNGGIVWDDETLYVLDTDSENPDNDMLRIFRYDSASQCIYYGNNSPQAASLSSDDLLAEHVSALSVSFPDGTDEGYVKSVKMEISLQRQNKTYTGTQTLALRNVPLTAAGVSDLLAAVYP